MNVDFPVLAQKKEAAKAQSLPDVLAFPAALPCDIVWLRDDLRVSDNEALLRAAQSCVICVYVMSQEECSTKTARTAWLRESLFSLESDLRALGSCLVVVESDDPVSQIVKMADHFQSRNIYINASKSPDGRHQEAELIKTLPPKTIAHILGSPWIVHPEKIMTKSGTPFRVFTHFFKCFSEILEKAPLSAPLPRPSFVLSPSFVHCNQISIVSCQEKPWARDVMSRWAAGEASALLRLNSFIQKPADYLAARNHPDLKTTTLSPHLRHGEISEKTLWSMLHKAAILYKKEKTVLEGIASLMRQLAWREFSYYLWYHDNEFPFSDWQKSPITWESVDQAWLARWKKGRTGIPLVDAGMRELWQTGWMHNRVRMVVADHFCKHMGYDWRIGASWFLETLVDADVANNSMGWQWASGTGPDAAPYYRVFNPTLQAQKFDPKGEYRRLYLAELSGCSLEEITEPWLFPKLSSVYPLPEKTPTEGRKRALASFEKSKKQIT